MPSDALREAIAARALRGRPQSGPVDAAASGVAALGGDAVRAIVFFGSRKTQASPGAHSAYDLFVLTRGYASFYGSLHAKGMLRRSPSLVAALNAVLPPQPDLAAWTGRRRGGLARQVRGDLAAGVRTRGLGAPA